MVNVDWDHDSNEPIRMTPTPAVKPVAGEAVAPCPFCGDAAQVFSRKADGDFDYQVICTGACAESPWFDFETDAYKWWNTRSAPTYEQGVAAGLEMAAKEAESWLGSATATHIANRIRALSQEDTQAKSGGV